MKVGAQTSKFLIKIGIGEVIDILLFSKIPSIPGKRTMQVRRPATQDTSAFGQCSVETRVGDDMGRLNPAKSTRALGDAWLTSQGVAA